MEYQNNLPPEGINTSSVHPLKQFFQMAVAAIVLVVILVVLLQFSGALLAKRIPFTFERAVIEQMKPPFGDSEAHPEMTAYLNELAQRLMLNMPMPEGMDVTVHYDSEKTFNAFATVGGNLLFYKGLLNRMQDENTLAMVMAHEISHVLHRDPIASMGGGVASTVALLGLTGNAGTGTAGNVLKSAGMLTNVQFTRSMELAADKQALAALYGTYGHVAGATELFEIFASWRDEPSGLIPKWYERFSSTHPLDQDRIDQTRLIADSHQWPNSGEKTPLPLEFSRWLLKK